MRQTKTKFTLHGDYYISPFFFEKEFHSIKQYLKNNNYNILNYEGCFGTPYPKGKPLIMSEESLGLPKNTLLSLANNHVFDAGQEGFKNLKSKLDSRKINFFGVESKINANDNKTILNIDGKKFCFAGFGWKNEECVPPGKSSYGIKNITENNLRNFFNSLDKAKFDYLIIYFHCGYEFEYYPLPLHVQLTRLSIKLGADLVFCSHTHCIQPYEIYNDKYIFYGLGNFYFSNDRDFYPEISDIGLIVGITIENNTLIPSEVKKIKFYRSKSGFKILEYMNYLNKNEIKISNLKEYEKKYSKIRTRKKNPRPIMYSENIITNEIKYLIWLFLVKITGYLGIRQLIKRILKW